MNVGQHYEASNNKFTSVDAKIASNLGLIKRFTNIPLANPGGLDDVIMACNNDGMCFQADGTGPAPEKKPYSFYRCMHYGAVWVIVCYVASSRKIFICSKINDTWNGWKEVTNFVT